MGLAGVMTVGMCVPVLAAEDTNKTITEASESTANAEVEFKITPTYSITIPTVLTPGGSVTPITGVGNIEEGSTVNVKITNGVTNGKITMQQYEKDGTTPVGSEVGLIDIKLGSNNYENDKAVAAFVSGTDGVTIKNNVTDELTLGNAPADKQAGTYKGTVTFTVSYE